MRINPEFPEYHHNEPRRQAELRVYHEIEASQRPGQALYGVKAARHTPEVDFVVWVENVACFAIEVKGGIYSVENGTLFRQGPNGPEQVVTPPPKAMDGTLSISNAIKDRLEGACYTISILLFPDMEENDEIRRWAQCSRPNVVFGVDDLVRCLAELEDVAKVHYPPPAYRIEQEVAVLMPEAQPEANQSARPRGLPTALHAPHVVIENLEMNLVINLYAGPGAVPFLQQATDVTEEGDADAENQD